MAATKTEVETTFERRESSRDSNFYPHIFVIGIGDTFSAVSVSIIVDTFREYR